MEWVLEEVLDSEVPLLPGPMSVGEEAASPGAGLTGHIIRQHLDGRQEFLKPNSTF